MCGRYRLSRRQQVVEECFDAVAGDDYWSPRYNIAPSQLVPVIRRTDNFLREWSLLRWGLIPSWAKNPSIGLKTINARSETVTTAASFRDAFKSRRCLIPADGFYEWKKRGAMKQPYCFEVGDGQLFAFAGLWDSWKDGEGKTIETCTILTTTSNVVLSGIHNRMPVILNPDDYESWLHAKPGDMKAALRLLTPCMAPMRGYPVSMRINHVQNDDAECAKHVEPELPRQGQLCLRDE